MELFLEYFEFILFVVLLALGYSVGRVKERRHYRSIRRRERELAGVLAFGIRFPPDPNTPRECVLVTGSVVVARPLQAVRGGLARSSAGAWRPTRRSSTARGAKRCCG
jgi:hypothetical protein